MHIRPCWSSLFKREQTSASEKCLGIKFRGTDFFLKSKPTMTLLSGVAQGNLVTFVCAIHQADILFMHLGHGQGHGKFLICCQGDYSGSGTKKHLSRHKIKLG